jgi:flagellar export protein FliJ
MAFQFSLRGLLRVRQSFEKREEQDLAIAIGELKQLNTALEQVREELTSSAGRFASLLARGTIGAELHLVCYEGILLERREEVLMGRVATALKDVQAQQVRLQEAKQKRKILENLREKQLALFVLKRGRRDQQMLDDAFLSRRINDPTGKSVA